MVDVISYPTGLQYQEALYNTGLAFSDPELRGGAPVLDRLGMPKAISGNFASVFIVDGTGGRRWAVKCFTRHVPDQALRYERVSKALRGISSPWKVEFQYLPNGVLCRGTWYPALKMEWVEAVGLLPYVEEHLTDTRALTDLAGKFAGLVGDLSRHGIAHGDLQHGNILVTPSGELKLVDYDGMFVPELSGLGASEWGHRNYQSPLRTAAHWGPDIDRFSAWVIYTSLSALALDPMLWQALHADGDEALLFHQSDFRDRDGSRARSALARSPVAKLRETARDIDFLWAADLAAIPPLEMILGPGSPRAAREPATANLRPRAGLEWLRQHQAAAGDPGGTVSSSTGSAQATASATTSATAGQAVAGQGRPIGTAAWLTTHLTNGPSVEFSPVKIRYRVVSAAALLVLLALFIEGVVYRSASLAGFFASLGLCALLAGCFAFLVSYRNSPEVKEKRRHRRTFRAYRSAAARANRAASALEKDARKRAFWAERKRSAAERRAEKARADEQREIDIVSRRLDREIQGLNDKISALQSEENAELGNALLALQRAHIDQRLRATRVAVSRIPGIGPVGKVYLVGVGLVTAADIAGVRGASIVRPNGTLVSPHGVGEQRAAALYAWRLDVEAQARVTQPTALPSAQRQLIASNYALRKRSLESDQAAARARMAAETSGVRRKWATTHDDIARQVKQASARVSARRADLDPKITAARRQWETLEWQRDFAKRELARYRRITYWRYLGRLVKG